MTFSGNETIHMPLHTTNETCDSLNMKKLLLFPYIVSISIIGSVSLQATDFTWTSGAAANWTGAGVWSPSGPPTASDNVIGNSGNGTLQLNGGVTRTVSNFSITTGDWNIRSAPGTNTLRATNTFTKAGSGTSVLFDNGNTFVFNPANLAVTGGTLELGSSGNVINSVTVDTATTVDSGAILDLNVTNAASLGALTANGTVRLANSSSAVVRNIVVTSLGGTGTVAGNAAGGTGITAFLTINGSSGSTFSGTISNGTGSTVSLTKSGSGTQVFGGANTYGGGTTVSEGTLLIDNVTGSGLGTGAVLVSGNGTLGGTGAVTLAAGNSVTVQGVLDVGNGAGAAIFDVTTSGGGTLAFSNNSALHLDIWTNTLSGADRLATTGGVSIGTNVTLTLANAGGIVFANGNSFDLFDWGTTPSGSQFVLSLPSLSGGLSWDTSTLYTTGVISVVPEPGTAALLIFVGMSILLRGRSWNT